MVTFFENILSKWWINLIILSAVCLLTYSNTFHNVFTLDDHHVIENNPAIRHVFPISRFFVHPETMSILDSNVSYRPLLPLTLSFTYAFWKTNVVGYHIYNLLFHVFGVLIWYAVFLLLAGLINKKTKVKILKFAPLLAALIYAVHPLSGSVVNYLCARDLLMMQFFLGTSFYFYLKNRIFENSVLKWVAVVAFFILALLAKTPAITMPFVILTAEIILFKSKLFSKRLWGSVIAYLVPAIFMAIIVNSSSHFQGPDKSLQNIVTNLLTQCNAHIFYYLRNYFWPFPIRVLPSVETVTSFLDFKTILSCLIILSSFIWAYLYRKKFKVISFCIFAYWIMFMPTSSVFPLFQYVSDRWMFTSLPYLCFVTSIIVCLFLPRVIKLVLGIALVIYFGFVSFTMNYNWKSSLDIYKQCAEYGTDAIGYMNLGLQFRRKNDAEAEYYYKKSLEKAPNYYLAYINLGVMYMQQGKTNEGLAFIEKGAALTPGGCEPYSYPWLFYAYARMNFVEKACDTARKLKILKPDSVDRLYNLGFSTMQEKQFNDATKCFDILHNHVSNYKISRFCAGWCKHAVGRYREALEEYKLAIKYSPDYAQTYANMGFAYMRFDEYDKALEAFRKHLLLKPDNKASKNAVIKCKLKLQEIIE